MDLSKKIDHSQNSMVKQNEAFEKNNKIMHKQEQATLMKIKKSQ
jgi:hypothetical protein